MEQVLLVSQDIRYGELVKKNDLRDYFALRYRECLAERYHIAANREGLNIEPFDFFSRFVGAFVREESGERLIGGVRMVDRYEEGPAAEAIREICLASPELKPLIGTPRPHPFQLMEVPELIGPINACAGEGERLVEFSRTVVEKEYRRSGAGTGLVREILALAASLGADAGFGGCPERLQEFYERAGNEVVAKFYHPLHNCRAALLKVDLRRVREEAAASAALRDSGQEVIKA